MSEFEISIYNTDRSNPRSNKYPGAVAWEYLKKYLQPEDEIWTFGILDTGFVIIRNSKLFCLVVTDHHD